MKEGKKEKKKVLPVFAPSAIPNGTNDPATQEQSPKDSEKSTGVPEEESDSKKSQQRSLNGFLDLSRSQSTSSLGDEKRYQRYQRTLTDEFNQKLDENVKFKVCFCIFTLFLEMFL